MRIDQPSFSGSISQDRDNAIVTNLSGSFTGSFTGDISVEQAEFVELTVTERLTIGQNSNGGVSLINSGSVEFTGSFEVVGDSNFTGSVNTTEGYFVDGVDVLDTSLAFAIALG